MKSAVMNGKITQAAVRFLNIRGYDLLDETPTSDYIDLVALDGSTLVFLTIKSRTTSEGGFPSEQVNRTAFELDAINWLATQPNNSVIDKPFRFDVISLVVISDTKAVIRHHLNAIEPDPVTPEA